MGIDIAGIGFENHKLILQIGRGRQSWSAGNNIGIALSEESYGYDYGLFGLKLDNFRARYMHGFWRMIHLIITIYYFERNRVDK